jgi:nitrite reductase (NADH) large subunit
MTGTVVVVGHGMVGHRLVATLRERDRAGAWRIVVLGEEPHLAYDRLALSSYLDGRSILDLTLVDHDLRADPLVELRPDTTVVTIDRARRTVWTADGIPVPYDVLVLATGSRPFVPPVPGHDAPGCHVYRTIDDLDGIRTEATPGRTGVVIGGGLLGLEAANALRMLGMHAHVVELATHLMPQQVDHAGGRLLGDLVAELGLTLWCGAATAAIDTSGDGRVRAVILADGRVIETGLVVFSTGIRPRDELATAAGLASGLHGGVLVDGHCRTADRRIFAVGECAALRGRCHGLVAPGYRMAEVVVDQLLGRKVAPLSALDMSTRLKTLGVEVASFGDLAGGMAVSYAGPGRYASLTLSGDATVLLGGILVGDASAYDCLRPLVGRKLSAPPEILLRRR